MKLTLYGAAQEVTGSCTLIDTGRTRVLIDCGLFQGASVAHERNLEAFKFDPKSIDAVILTHAHIDHIGRFPRLVKAGFSGRTFATHPTRALTKLMWIDAAKVMKDDAKRHKKEPIYLMDDVWPAHELVHGMPYDTEIVVSGDFKFRFREAGHIFGSAFLEIEADGVRFTASGDLGNDNVPILRPTAASAPADLVMLESTYGDRLHDAPGERVKRLKQAIKDTIKRQGTLLVPAFSLERTQEILYELNGLVENHQVPRIPVFLDSPLAIKVLPIYHQFSEYYNREAKELAKRDNFFEFPGLKVTRKPDESAAISTVPPPKIIIAGSGMMHGGRIMHHLVEYLNNDRNTLLIVGFQSAGTLGHQVMEGANHVVIDHEEIMVRAKVDIIGSYSAHADQAKLIRWTTGGSELPKKVLLNHGELGAMEALADMLKENRGLDVALPSPGQEIEV